MTTDNEAGIEPINHVVTASETAIELDDLVAVHVSSKVKVSEDCGVLYLMWLVIFSSSFLFFSR